MEELTAAGILNDFVRIQDESRTSTLLVDPALGTSTEIVEYGPSIEPAELEMVAAKLAYLMRGVSTAVFAGSLPRDVPEDWYATALRDARRARLQTVLDSEGEPLRLGLAGEPDLVAPNQLEAEELVGFEFQTPADFALGTRPDRRHGCAQRADHARHRVRGADPRAGQDAPAVGRDRALEPVSEVGSGDALLAGFLAARGRTDRSTTCCAARSAAAPPHADVRGGLVRSARRARLAGTVTLRELHPPSD